MFSQNFRWVKFAEIRWHFIGTLQSDTAEVLAVIPNLYSIQTFTSIKATGALNKALPPECTALLNILIQINTSGKDSKWELSPLSAEDVVNTEVMQLAWHIIKEYPQLQLQGLMTISALEQLLVDTDENTDFEQLKGTQDVLTCALMEEFGVERWGEGGRLLLIMGMSSNFEATLKAGAILEGVSHP
ncbi:hypothetical protein K438DRAFT_1979325 [Mycena galopus ATCC 62051]|nr:hypothetical protein K438DRAFT_1979325 [Mycena galopus ATCC 62051]